MYKILVLSLMLFIVALSTKVFAYEMPNKVPTIIKPAYTDFKLYCSNDQSEQIKYQVKPCS